MRHRGGLALFTLIVYWLFYSSIAFAQSTGTFNVRECGLDGPTMKEQAELHAKGYPDDEIFGACAETARWSSGRADRMEDAVVLFSLGFTTTERRRVLRRNVSLGDYLLHAYHTNEHRQIAGGVFTAGGTVMTMSGIALIAVFHEGSDPEFGGNEEDVFRSLGIVISVIGLLTTASGVSLLAITKRLSSRYPAPKFLWDSHNADEIERWYKTHPLPRRETKRVHLDLFPVIAREYSGMAIGGRF